jgi:hypothetical protein
MRRRTRALLLNLLKRALILGAVAGAVYVYFFTGTFTIRDYRIVGAPSGYEETLIRQIGFLAEQKLFGFLPGNRVLSYHDGEIRTTITEILPNTKNIQIYPSGAHTITIRLMQHVPVFSVSDTHAMSTEGVVYREIIPLDPFPRLEVATSTEVASKRLIEISELAKNMSDILYPVRFVSIDEHDDIRLYDERKASAIILRQDFDMARVWSNILSAIDTDPLKGRLASELESLEYIDTRFGNKIFYKFTMGGHTGIPSEDQNHDNVATTTVQ